MDLELWLREVQRNGSVWWQSLGPDAGYYVWLAGGAALLIVWALVSHRIIRKVLGHRKFRGTWYNAEQMEVLVKMIDEDNAKGHRVMKHDEMSLLRKWRFGSGKSSAFERGSGYL